MRGPSLLLPLLTAVTLSAQTVVVDVTRSLYNSVTCFDEARQRLVVATPARELWEWDGADWGRMEAALPAAPTAAVYDPARQRVCFVAGGRLLTYDGHACLDRGPVPAGVEQLVVADRQRGRLFALGANSYILPLGYEWDGVGWQQVGAIPGPCFQGGLAYDELRHVAVTNVRRVGAGSAIETWEWDGAQFALRATTANGGGSLGPLAYDPARRQVLAMFGFSQAWNGTTWTPLGVQVPLSPRSLANDPVRGVLWALASSGANPGAHTFAAWDGAAWSTPLAPPHPENRDRAGFTFDALRARAVLFGGFPGGPTDLLD